MGTSSETKQVSNAQTDPWAPQAGALTSAFSNAQNAYSKASTATAPTDFTAQFTPDQLSTFKSMLGYANGNTTPDTTSATGTTLMNSGANAATGALSGLAGFDPTKLNNTQSIIDSANKFADGQNIDAQVANSMLPALQQARDVTMPGIEQHAAMTGNTDSSRTGIADGLVQRGLAEQSANLGATLRSDAFKTGLQLASNNATSNNQLGLGALSDAASAGTGAANAGVNAGSTGIADKGSLYDLANAAGTGEQSADQAHLTNQLQQYQSQTTSPYDALNGLMGIIGSNNWGSTSNGTTTQTKTPSAFEMIGGLLGAAAGGKKLFGF